MTHVLVAENQTLIGQMLKRLVETDSNFEVAAEADNSCDVIDKLQRFKIDLLVLDLSNPSIFRTDLITRTKASDPKLAILALSMHPENKEPCPTTHEPDRRGVFPP